MDPHPDPLFRGTDPRIRIRIRTKMSRIWTKMSGFWNTGCRCCIYEAIENQFMYQKNRFIDIILSL
jgi:hypothetical protein